MDIRYSLNAQQVAQASPDIPICGVYGICHLPSGRFYVGQSKNVVRRWRSHISGKRGAIGEALRFHGLTEFSFSILSDVPPDKLDEHELGWIKLLDAIHPSGFNLVAMHCNKPAILSARTRELSGHGQRAVKLKKRERSIRHHEQARRAWLEKRIARTGR